MTTLSAVPNQAGPPPHPREVAFRHLVEESLERLKGSEAVDQITRQYRGDVDALRAQVDTGAAEATQFASQSRMHYDMLTQVQIAASHGLWERAALSSELSGLKNVIGEIISILDRTNGDQADTVLLRKALSKAPEETVHRSTVLAVYPDRIFRGAVFKSLAGDVTMTYPFCGWALVDHGPGAIGSIEPMFIVQDRALPRSSVETEFRLKFETYLQHAYRSAG